MKPVSAGPASGSYPMQLMTWRDLDIYLAMPVSVGTDLTIVQEGVPDVIPAEACYLGWQESLTLLAKLVEAEIPD